MTVYFNYEKNDEAADALCKETGATGIKCSVRDSAAVEKMAEKIGDIDILINNAGISRINLFTDISEQEWDDIFDVNIKGMFLVTRAFLPGMIRRKYGKIINISSMWGVTGGSCEVHYSASKAAVIGFTKALAKEEGPSGINVNCIAPGVIETEMNAQLDDEAKRELCEETPLMRLGKPEEIANAALFLASDAASFITGQVICSDGGITI
jgi:3-oxoacyl-[acyl-carrier protein] reductase